MIVHSALYPSFQPESRGEGMPEQPRVYTVEQVAEMLQLHPRTVNRMLERGELRGVRAGRLWRIPTEAVEEYLRGETREKGEER